MTDFGLGDNTIHEDFLIKQLKWHGLLRTGYPSNPIVDENGMVSDSGKPLKSGILCAEQSEANRLT